MRLFYNFTFRLAVSFAVIILTVALSLYFILPTIQEAYRVLFLFLVVAVSIIEVVVVMFINRRMLLNPMRKITEASRQLTKGEYVKLKMKYADNDLRILANNLNNTAYEFENLEQMRKSFVSNASHELRSPLTSMQGFLQAILDGTIVGDEERDKYLKIVLRETKRLSSLINSMLDLSRMESGKNPITLSRFDINIIIRHVVERFEPNLIKKEIQLAVDFVRESSYVFADKDKIVQVLINLIDNAIKYSPPHSRVLITTHIHGKKIYITVKDKGYGISKREQGLIWDRFYMADKARTPAMGKGTGLGLSIVKKIIDDHKEVIWVESNKGAGTTFIFTLSLFDPSKHKVPQKSTPVATNHALAVIPDNKQTHHKQ